MKTVEEQIIDIEIMLANMQRMLDDLNFVAIDQGKSIDNMKKQMQHLLDVAKAESVKPIAEETPPPHY